MYWEEDYEEPLSSSGFFAALRPSRFSLSKGKPIDRSPAEQAEIDRRVAIYERQVQEHGIINWLPFRGEGD